MKTEITDVKILEIASSWANEKDISVHHHSAPFDELKGTPTNCGSIDNHALNEELCQYLEDEDIMVITVVDNDQEFSGEEGAISCLFASIDCAEQGGVIEYIVKKANGSLRLDGFATEESGALDTDYTVFYNGKYYYGFESE